MPGKSEYFSNTSGAPGRTVSAMCTTIPSSTPANSEQSGSAGTRAIHYRVRNRITSVAVRTRERPPAKIQPK